MKQVMWSFATKNFKVVATIEPDEDLDLSWDEDGEVAEKLDNGQYKVFGTRVRVYHGETLIGEDTLWGSVYSDPKTFFSDHRDPDAMNRNCSLMRAAKGANVCICHYFPCMVRAAIDDARRTLSNMRSTRVRAWTN